MELKELIGLNEILKSWPDEALENAIKKAKQNMKISNKVLLLARRELKKRKRGKDIA